MAEVIQILKEELKIAMMLSGTSVPSNSGFNNY